MMEALPTALLLFSLRVVNNAFSTIRLIMLSRGKRLISAVFAFIESLIFAVTVASVVNDLTNPLILAAYAGGFAVGSYVGMYIENRFIKGYMTVNVITSNGGHDIAVSMRNAGFGVTETVGDGKDGKVAMLRSVVERKDVSQLMKTVREINPEAFISVEELHAISHGYVRPSHVRQ